MYGATEEVTLVVTLVRLRSILHLLGLRILDDFGCLNWLCLRLRQVEVNIWPFLVVTWGLWWLFRLEFYGGFLINKNCWRLSSIEVDVSLVHEFFGWGVVRFYWFWFGNHFLIDLLHIFLTLDLLLDFLYRFRFLATLPTTTDSTADL